MILDHPIRSVRRIYFFAGYALLFAAAMLVCGGLAVTKWGAKEGLPSALAGAAFFLAVALPAIWYAIRVWRAELRIGIPMRPGVKSLNLATAVAVILYSMGLPG